jgi:DNA-binding transcriptional ArsR family regulator
VTDGVFAALAHPTRRAVLALLQRNGRMSVNDIAQELAVVGPTLSGHLKVLRGADLVTAQRQGTTIYYVTNLSVLQGALAALMHSMGVTGPGGGTGASPAGAPRDPGGQA